MWPYQQTQKTKVPTLGAICRRIAKAHIDQIQYMPENLPWYKAKELLVFVKKAEQLAFIEDASPHLVQDSDELWEPFVKKKFSRRFRQFMAELSSEQHTDQPIYDGSWRELYIEWWEEDQRKEAQDIALLEFQADKRQQEIQAKGANLVPARAMRSLHGGGSWRLGSSFSRSYANRSQSAVQKAKMEAKEASRRRSLAKSWVQATGSAGISRHRMKNVPRGLVDEVRIRMQPKFVPRGPAPPYSIHSSLPVDDETTRREARLLARKNGTSLPSDSSKADGGATTTVVNTNKGSSSASMPTVTSATRRPKTPITRSTTNLLFPSGIRVTSQQKVVTKTTGGSAATKHAPLSTSPERDGMSPAATPSSSRPSTVAPAKRLAAQFDTVPESVPAVISPPPENGPGSPPARPPPRKRKKVDVFMPKKRT